ncbi:MAG: ABC transporter permease [Thermofilaceae archaeon]
MEDAKKMLGPLGSRPIARFLARKTAFLVATYFVYSIVIFILPRAIPGNPLAEIIYQISQTMQTNPEQIREVELSLMEQFGLTRPLHEQFIDYMSRILRGDLGISYSIYPRRVANLIFEELPWTLALLIPATLVSWILGNLLGALAGYKRGGKTDNVILPLSIILSQTPYYWLAMILLYTLAVRWKVFPTYGSYPPGMQPAFTIEFIRGYLYHYALPFLSITLAAIGGWAIGMRVLVIYELRADYVDFADSLGIGDNKLLRYVFRNSMLPQVTGLALNLGTILGGALLTELVFNYRGTGYLIFRALTRLDYPLIQGTFLILFFTLILANSIVDIVYAIIDPRIKTGYVSE